MGNLNDPSDTIDIANPAYDHMIITYSGDNCSPDYRKNNIECKFTTCSYVCLMCNIQFCPTHAIYHTCYIKCKDCETMICSNLTVCDSCWNIYR